MGIHILDLAASSAIFWASASNIKSDSKGISVFHSFNPPKSFSPAFKVFVSDVVIASALVAARKIAMELFFLHWIFFFYFNQIYF